MATVLKLGPDDHGRPMTYEQFMAADYEHGYRYELIQGKLYVAPQPNPPHSWYTRYALRKLDKYSELHPETINWVDGNARVFIRGSHELTAPEPDIAAYRNYPDQPPADWRDVSPILVVEVLGGEDDEKDLVRNVDLYRQIPSIQEYWIFDIRDDVDSPTMIVHRRHGGSWKTIQLDCDATYTTTLLPGFSLPIKPQWPVT